MQLDAFQIFDTATAVTNTSVASANILDLLAARDLGPGERINGIVICNQAFAATGTTATINIQVQVSTATNGTWSTILESGVLNSASLGGSGTGTTRAWDFTLAKNNQALGGQRYMRLNYLYATGSTAFASGTFNAFLLDGGDFHQYYASGFTVSN